MRLKTNKYSRLIYHPPITDKKEKGVNISDALIIGISTLMGYGLLFAFNISLFAYFGIPFYFMSFDLPELLVCILGVIMGGFYLSIFTELIYKTVLRMKSKTVKGYILMCIFFVSLLFMLMLYTYLFSFSVLYYIFSSFLIILLLSPLVIALFSKDKGNYLEKLDASIKKFFEFRDRIGLFGVINRTVDYIGTKWAILFWVYLMTSIILGLIGGILNYYRSSFDIIKTIPECAIVYTKSDSVICKTIDREKKEFYPDYKVYFFSDLKGVDIVKEDIGILHPKSTSTPTVIPTIIPILPTPTIIPTKTPTPFE
jgi:hypothetical protein